MPRSQTLSADKAGDRGRERADHPSRCSLDDPRISTTHKLTRCSIVLLVEAVAPY